MAPTDAKEIQLLDVQTTLENTRKQLGEQATTIDAFRFKVRNLERDLGEVRRREEEEVAQASQLNEKSQALLEQNMQLRVRASCLCDVVLRVRDAHAAVRTGRRSSCGASSRRRRRCWRRGRRGRRWR